MGKVSDFSSSITSELSNSEESIRRGEYAVIRSLIRVLEVPDNSLFLLPFFAVNIFFSSSLLFFWGYEFILTNDVS